MAFDPNSFLAKVGVTAADIPTPAFDPDTFLDKFVSGPSILDKPAPAFDTIPPADIVPQTEPAAVGNTRVTIQPPPPVPESLPTLEEAAAEPTLDLRPDLVTAKPVTTGTIKPFARPDTQIKGNPVQPESREQLFPSDETIKRFTSSGATGEWESLIPDIRDEKNRGFLSDLSEAWKRGKLDVQLDIMSFDAIEGDNPDYYDRVVKPLKTKYHELLREDPVKAENWFKNNFLKAVRLSRGMFEGYKKGIPIGLGYAATAFALGQAGPQAALPEEVLSLPLAFGSGIQAGSTIHWFKQGSGSMYSEMRDQGISHDIAKYVAVGGGVPYAIIENLQFNQLFGKLAPGLAEGARRAVNESLLSALKQVGKTYGSNWFKEVGEEALQEITTIVSRRVATGLESYVNENETKQPGLKEDVLRVGRSITESAGPLLIMGLPGGAVTTVEELRGIDPTAEAEPPAALPPAATEPDAPPAPTPDPTTPPTPDTIPLGGLRKPEDFFRLTPEDQTKLRAAMNPKQLAVLENLKNKPPEPDTPVKPDDQAKTTALAPSDTPTPQAPIPGEFAVDNTDSIYEKFAGKIVPIIDPISKLFESINKVQDEGLRKELQRFADLGKDSVIPNVISFQLLDQFIKDLEAQGVPIAYGRADMLNLGGRNKANNNVHSKTNIELATLCGQIFAKELAKFGGVVARDKGDELVFLLPGFNGAEGAELVTNISQQVDKQITKMGLDDTPHPKHSGMITGALNLNFGVVTSEKGKRGETDRDADEIAENFANQRLFDKSQEQGYTYNKETNSYEPGKQKPEAVRPEERPAVGAPGAVVQKQKPTGRAPVQRVAEKAPTPDTKPKVKIPRGLAAESSDVIAEFQRRQDDNVQRREVIRAIRSAREGAVLDILDADKLRNKETKAQFISSFFKPGRQLKEENRLDIDAAVGEVLNTSDDTKIKAAIDQAIADFTTPGSLKLPTIKAVKQSLGLSKEQQVPEPKSEKEFKEGLKFKNRKKLKAKASSAQQEKTLTEFMKDSKVVNTDGTPKIIYHGTDAERFDVFDIGLGGKNYDDGASRIGVFFTEDPVEASFFGKNVNKYYVSIKNPKHITDEDISAQETEWLEDLRENDPEEYEFQTNTKQYQNSRNIKKGLELAVVEAKRQFHDGAIVDLEGAEAVWDIVFSGDQIRLVTEKEFKERLKPSDSQIDLVDPVKKLSANQISKLTIAEKRDVRNYIKNKKEFTNPDLTPKEKGRLRRAIARFENNKDFISELDKLNQVKFFSRSAPKQTELFKGETEGKRAIEREKRERSEKAAAEDKGTEKLPLFDDNLDAHMKDSQQKLFSKGGKLLAPPGNVKGAVKKFSDKTFKDFMPGWSGKVKLKVEKGTDPDVEGEIEMSKDGETAVVTIFDHVSPERIEFVIAHEIVGHFGFRQMLEAQPKVENALQNIWSKSENDPVFKEVQEKYAKDFEAVKKEQGSLVANWLMFNEWLALHVERHVNRTARGKDALLSARIYNTLKKAFKTLLSATGFRKITNEDRIESIINTTLKALKDSGGRISDKQVNKIFESGQRAVFKSKETPAEPPAKEPPASKGPEGPGVEPDTHHEGFTVPTETLRDQLIQKVQDKFKRLKTVQESIIKSGKEIPESSDAYLTEELFHGKVEDEILDLEQDHVKPLLKAMAKENVDVDELGLYLYAKHAPERNKQIAEINPRLREKGIAGSGRTDADAAAILENFEKSGMTKTMDALAARIYEVNNNRLDLIEQSGLEAPAVVEFWRKQYDNYVPLKGFETPPDGKDDPAPLPAVGKGFDIRGRESRRALGRKSRAANIVAHAIAQAEESIIRSQKNDVGRAFLKLVRENPNKDLWEIDAIEELPYFDERTGEVRYRIDPRLKLADEVLAVKEGGDAHFIKIKDPALVAPLKNIGVDKTNKVLQTLAAINRYVAMINTSLTPEFVASNFVRDIQTAVTNISGEQSIKLAAKVASRTPMAMRGAYRGLRGKESTNEWQDWFKRFKKAGGKIGFFGLENIDRKQQKLINSVQAMRPGKRATVSRMFRATGSFIMDVNGAVENASRLSFFRTLVESGVSEAKAASAARNITVNFNRKGELGSLFNSLFVFANAGVQGTARLFKAMRSPKMRKIAGSIVLGSFMLAEMNRSIAGEDEDDENFYDKIPDWTKENNLIIMLPETKGKHIKIPLPYGYNVFYAIGEAVNSAVHNPGKMPQNAAHVAATAANAFNPLGGSKNFLQIISPTITDPIVDIGLNQNFAGIPIKPNQPKFGPSVPESQLKFRGAGKISTGVAEALNSITGGSKFEEGFIDVNPEVMDHVVQYITGGLGRTINNVITTSADIVQGRELTTRKIPFVRRFVGEIHESDASKKFFERANDIEQITAEMEHLKKIEPEKVAGFRKEKRRYLAMQRHLERAESKLTELRKRKKREAKRGNEKGVELLNFQINKQFKRFNLRWNQIVK